MKKQFNYGGLPIEIEKKGYGQYIIRSGQVALRSTDSTIWDWCDDDDNEAKMEEAQKAAHRLIVNSDSYNEDVR